VTGIGFEVREGRHEKMPDHDRRVAIALLTRRFEHVQVGGAFNDTIFAIFSEDSPLGRFADGEMISLMARPMTAKAPSLESLGAGQTLLADRAYDSDALRKSLAERGAWANVKPMPRCANILVFSSYLKLKHFRTVATRFEKRDEN
jgi:hypothetical protein